ncbi:MAG: hypothetical protein H0U48_07415 [Euzebyaceae bacterium]|nr:hypothetical protein [Euzebyaceae bacterium]
MRPRNFTMVLGVVVLASLLAVSGLAACSAAEGRGSVPAAASARPRGAGDAVATDAGSAGLLPWSPPRLSNPTTIDVATLTPRPGAPRIIRLDPRRDYRIRMPDTALRRPLVILGGRNVVLIGGAISIPYQGPDASIEQRRGLLLIKQTGTVHVEGLLLTGADLSEGIQIASPEAVVQLQNIRVEQLHARDQVRFSDNHPDIVQPWGGVRRLRIGALTGQTNYQGLFLKEALGPIGAVQLWKVNIKGSASGRQLLWREGQFDISVNQVYLEPAKGRSLQQALWGRWTNVLAGPPPNGDFVPRGLAGPNYRSAGYAPGS